ncbi:50S ribosomal protein L18e [Geoglobus acetivorans]|uniref:Large ribosomal subunit protein eL18 n=1 Tax=Geoglobus acetivorans TaxID=565033 RepID=A0ABZ3H426_GEOAI|nr:50S ribosomal protein L18e [Geoglobus acetivorans]
MSRIRRLQRRKSNPNLVRLIDDLLSASAEKEAKVWKEIAGRLAKPLRNYAEVNVGKLERYVKDGEMAVVPGKVLGGGEISRPVTVAAFRFSDSARAKIEAAGGKCLSIQDALRENPEGKNVRIIV